MGFWLARRCRRLLFAAALLGASAADASLLRFEGRIVAVLPGLGETPVAEGTGVARVDAWQIRELEIVSAEVAGAASVPVTDPTAAPVTSIRIEASLATGLLQIDPVAPPYSEPAVTGPFALPGRVQVCMLVTPLPPCIGGFDFPLTDASGLAGVGVGGLLTVGGTASFRLSLHGAPFTLGTASATGVTASGASFTLVSFGSIVGPALFTSTAGRTGGRVAVVTPLRIRTAAGRGPGGLPGFLRLEVSFVPEPSRAIPWAGAGALLLALGRHRRSRSPRCRTRKTTCG